MKRQFVSYQHESSKMFKSDFLESLSKVHFTVPIFTYVPVILYFAIDALFFKYIGFGKFIISAISGLLFWTLTEYVLHRFVFHFQPKTTWGKRLHFIFHGVHHDYPNDALRLVMPLSVSVPLAISFYFLFKWLLPTDFVSAFFAAFISGYLFYDISHYAIHHANFKNAFWKKLKDHHMHHHYSDATKGFGVSSNLWDRVFRS
jgi:sterol desaturase/sphingolipid hydroxylase (fatty acid hydroxylase superfamily)